MRWRKFVQDYLTFNKKERWAVLSLLALVALAYFLPRLMGSNSATAQLTEDTTLLNVLDTFQKGKERFYVAEENSAFTFYDELTADAGFTETSLFAFDPNTLSADGWQKLGLANRTIKTLINYRNKGGRFYKPEDLRKIWGLPEAFYKRVAPYITIETKRSVYINPYAASTNSLPEPKGKLKVFAVPVNSADTTAFIALPGIGSKLAARIINFRDKLGGFYSEEQISETYGLPDSTFNLIKPYLQVDASAIKKININNAGKDELRQHPYIKWALANAIVEYRAQHGAFKSIDELKNIMLIDETTFKKIAPYFSL